MRQSVKLVQRTDSTVDMLSAKGESLRSFNVREDLDGALDLLKKINAVKTLDGTPIYLTHTYHDTSLWALHQQVLFLPRLRELQKYNEIIAFFAAQSDEFVVVFDPRLSDLAQYLTAYGVKTRTIRGKPLWLIFQFILRFAARGVAFLSTIVAVAKSIFFQPDILLYTPDKFHGRSSSDFRVAPLYTYLRSKSLRFVEIFHTTLGREFFSNLWNRKRLAIYLEAIPVPFFAFSPSTKFELSNFSKEIIPALQIILAELDCRARASKWRVMVLQHILKLAHPKLFISMDDPRYTGEIILASRTQHIPAHAFQHGHFTKYHAGWMNYGIPLKHSLPFDTLWVWNAYWQQTLLTYSELYTKETVKIGGPVRLPPAISFAKKATSPKQISDLTILIPYESIAPKPEVISYVQLLRTWGAALLFKPRPDGNAVQQLNEYGLDTSMATVVTSLTPDVLSKIDLVVGVYTTFLYEMIYYGKPIAQLETSFTMGSDLVDHGLAMRLTKDASPENIVSYVRDFQSKSDTAWPPAPVFEKTVSDLIKKYIQV